jgi:signal transduction histidine kinase
LKKILIIDDSDAMRTQLSKRLRELIKDPVQIHEASDGISGIKAAIELVPDLIFMDIVLPYLSGYAASVRLKNIPGLKDTKIVGMTSDVAMDTRGKVLSWCDDFLPKPIEKKALTEILDHHLHRDVASKRSRDGSRASSLKRVTVEIVHQLEEQVIELTRVNQKLEKQTGVIRHLYRETKTAKRRLKRLNQLRADFTDLLSHEVKTPLTAVTGYAECLRIQAGDRFTEEEAGMLDKIMAGSQRISLLINEISRLNQLKFKLRSGHSVLVSDVLEKVVKDRDPYIRDKSLKVIIKCEAGLVVPLDGSYLLEMVDHVVKNAIIFNIPGGKVNISCRRVKEDVEIEIKDNGIGIDPTYLNDVYNPLTQLVDIEHYHSHPLRGLGMGLTVCREMARNVGGSMVVSSDGPGMGTVVRIHVPIGRDQL